VCDTISVVRPGQVLFAKNSDRDANEAQLLDWQPAREHRAGDELRCTWLTIPQVRRTHAVLLSRPFWMWGAEMGANEHGLVIGNEAVFTRHPVPRVGLTGMDLLRLALERATTAREAVEVIVELADEFGQGGGGGHEDRDFRYHSSFLIADAGGVLILETAGPAREVEEVHAGGDAGVPAEGGGRARCISNALTIEGFAEVHSDWLKTTVARGRHRRSRTEALAASATGPMDLFALLRDHGADGGEPSYHWLAGGLGAPCVHAGGLAAASQTTASWVAEITDQGVRHWVTATAAPCTGLFKPIRVDRPLDLGPDPTDRCDGHSLWWRHEALHRLVASDPALIGLYAPERNRGRSSPPRREGRLVRRIPRGAGAGS